MKSNTACRILYVLKLLETYSDETHPLSVAQLTKLLEDRYNITAHRSTLYNDIAALEKFGVDIITVRSTQNRYFIGNRVFEIPQLRLLIDAISSSKCLTAKKSEELTERLFTLISNHQADTLRKTMLPSVVPKPQNEQIYYIIDAIHKAIEAKKTIDFSYIEYTPHKEAILRGDGEVYTLSPYACVWNGDYYYVIGWSEKRGDIATFRVDRIATTPTIGEEPCVLPPAGFDLTDYTSHLFQMFHGEEATVTLLCENDSMKSVIDKFSCDVETAVYDEEHFTVTTRVSLSPTFYGWIFKFGGKIRLLSPDNAVNEYKAMIEKALASL